MNKDEGLSILDLFKLIFFNWKRLIVMVFILSIVFCVILHFGYSAKAKVYSIDFQYTNDNLNKNSYANGSKFNYLDIISSNNVVQTIEKSDEYSGMDYLNLLAKNDVKIERVYDETSNEYSYVVSIKSSYFGMFGTKDKALHYLSDLISYPINTEKTIVSDSTLYNKYSDSLNSLTTYSDKVSYLILQYQDNLKNIDSVSSIFGDVYMSGASLSVVSLKYKTYFENYEKTLDAEKTTVLQSRKLDSLLAEIENKGYTDASDSSLNYFTKNKNSLISTIVNNNTVIKSLEDKRDEYIAKGQATTAEAFNEEIVTLVKKNSEYINELNKVERYLYNISLLKETSYEISEYATESLVKVFDSKQSYENSFKIFEADYNEAVSKIKEFSTEIQKYTIYSYSNFSTISFKNTSIIVQNGGFGLIVEIVISLVLGFVIAAIINSLIDHKRLNEIVKKEE